jgi:hypothetical protein
MPILASKCLAVVGRKNQVSGSDLIANHVRAVCTPGPTEPSMIGHLHALPIPDWRLDEWRSHLNVGEGDPVVRRSSIPESGNFHGVEEAESERSLTWDENVWEKQVPIAEIEGALADDKEHREEFLDRVKVHVPDVHSLYPVG